MFASLFRDGGIKWVGVFSYHHIVKTVTCFFAVLKIMLCNKLERKEMFLFGNSFSAIPTLSKFCSKRICKSE